MTSIGGLPVPLVDDFMRGRWLPIIGSGFSKNAKLPVGDAMPDWAQLASLLGSELDSYVASSPVDVISAYSEEFGRARLIERLSDLLHTRTALPGDSHLSLVRAGFDAVLTTNFDFLLESAFAAVSRPCQPVFSESQLSQRPLDDQSQLLKLHGDLNHPDQIVATEDDFDGFLRRQPLMATYVANLLITRTPVLIGYSFDDPDTRALWSLIRDRLGDLRRRGYALMVGSTASERARFARRGITVVDLPGPSYNVAFAELFDALRANFISNVGRVVDPADDDVAAELVLPTDAGSRLCYCSVPASKLSWYRSEVFPVIEEAGFVPVTLAEVTSPGASLAATTDALLARAQVALVDVANNATRYDLALATAALDPGNVIVVTEPDTAEQLSAKHPRVDSILIRHEEFLYDPIHFTNLLRARLLNIARRTSEPRELILQDHPAAALIVAFSEFEHLLTMHLTSTNRVSGLRRLVDQAAEIGWVTREELDRFRTWILLRNQAVHRSGEVATSDALLAIEDIERVLSRLPRRDDPLT